MADKYIAELSALQRWVKTTTGLDSLRQKEAPPRLARPVILWESPHRGRDRNLNRWAYVNKVTQFGKLFVINVDQLAIIQDKLFSDLEERTGLLPVYGAAGIVVTLLKNCDLTFSNSDTLNIPFSITYEITYTRVKPPAVPNATFVGNKIRSADGVIRDYNPKEYET